ncbi:DUF4240 domain-containing protein [Frondihabitans cladoniiphilus]|uniref:DUF4240 domain-containing protein n=1 Tax=Frondihabitans cladoniiphilus TaxID=715785 RepID=A0ABP8VUI6_9MICO
MNDFYDLIDAARGGVGDEKTPSADPDRLREVLEAIDDEAVLAFGVAFQNELIRLNEWRVWDAGYVASGALSNDGFHYFRSWLIGKGRAAVEQALADPDGLVPYLDDPDIDNELLEYVPIDVLEERGVDADPRDAIDESPDEEARGDQIEDEKTLDSYFPRLASWRASLG